MGTSTRARWRACSSDYPGTTRTPPGFLFPALVAISALPGALEYLMLKGTWSGWYVLAIPASMIVPVTVLTHAVIRKMGRSPVEELTDEWLAEGNAPWRPDLQALAILATFATWTLVDMGEAR